MATEDPRRHTQTSASKTTENAWSSRRPSSRTRLKGAASPPQSEGTPRWEILNNGLTETTREQLATGLESAPVWGRVLHKAGWTNISVFRSETNPDLYHFKAEKPAK